MAIFETPVEVRFSDLDVNGHVNNAIFFTYYTEGRVKFFHEIFNLSYTSNFPTIMAHVSCDYLKPIKLMDKIVLQINVLSIGKKSFRLGFKLVGAQDRNDVYAKGESVQVWYSYAEDKPRDIPEDLRQELAKYTHNGI